MRKDYGFFLFLLNQLNTVRGLPLFATLLPHQLNFDFDELSSVETRAHLPSLPAGSIIEPRSQFTLCFCCFCQLMASQIQSDISITYCVSTTVCFKPQPLPVHISLQSMSSPFPHSREEIFYLFFLNIL